MGQPHQYFLILAVSHANIWYFPTPLNYQLKKSLENHYDIILIFIQTLQEKASEILAVICEGYSKEDVGSKKHVDKLEPSGGGSSGTPSPPETSSTPSRFKSDHIVSRMRLFFQGSSATKEPRSHSPQPQRRWGCFLIFTSHSRGWIFPLNHLPVIWRIIFPIFFKLPFL